MLCPLSLGVGGRKEKHRSLFFLKEVVLDQREEPERRGTPGRRPHSLALTGQKGERGGGGGKEGGAHFSLSRAFGRFLMKGRRKRERSGVP